QFRQALEGAKAATKSLADTVEQQAAREKRTRAEIEQLEREYQQRQRRRAQEAAAIAGERGRAQARAQVQALEATFREEMARIREAQARGFLTPRQAMQAGRESAQAFNTGVLQVLDQGQLNRSLVGPQGRQAYTEIAGQIKNLDDAARKGSVGFHRLNNSMI